MMHWYNENLVDSFHKHPMKLKIQMCC